VKLLNAKNKRCLVIPDAHAPFEHPDLYSFLIAVKEKYLDKNSLVINLGDEIDSHSISFHDTDPDMQFSPSGELEAAIDSIKRLEAIFPKMYLCESNHGSLVYRRQKHHGLPRHLFKSYNEILGVKKWSWHEEIILQTKMGDIYLCHGKTSANGKLVKEMGCYGAVQGHFHGKMQIIWQATAIDERFDAYAGCLIDRESMAFAYGKNHIPKPLLGCMIISKSGYPRIIKMNLDSKNRWDKALP